MMDDVAIFLDHESAVKLSTRMSDLGQGGWFVLGSLIESRTAFHESMIVAFSRILIVIWSRDFVLRHFRVLRTMKEKYSAQL